MPRPLVIAYHLVWTGYGTWLPNDPRGSGSREVRNPALAELGKLHFGRRKLQPASSQIRNFYQRATPQLQFSVLQLNESQRQKVAEALAECISAERYKCYACAILPDHVHLVIRKHKHLAETMLENLQTASRLRLSNAPEIPSGHPIWTAGGWKVFLDSPDHVRSVIQYIERNPIKAKLPPQKWPFVTPYNNWPFHKAPTP